jgi:hypothetical protein
VVEDVEYVFSILGVIREFEGCVDECVKILVIVDCWVDRFPNCKVGSGGCMVGCCHVIRCRCWWLHFCQMHLSFWWVCIVCTFAVVKVVYSIAFEEGWFYCATCAFGWCGQVEAE